MSERLNFDDLQLNDAVCRDIFPCKPFIVAELNWHERIVVLREARGRASRPFNAQEFEDVGYVRLK